MQEIVFNTIPSVLLMLVAGWAALKTILDSFFAREKGTIVACSRPSDVWPPGLSCRSGVSSNVVLVELGDHETVEAEISPCCACIERLKEGDAVTITRLGGRVLAQRGSIWGSLR